MNFWINYSIGLKQYSNAYQYIDSGHKTDILVSPMSLTIFRLGGGGGRTAGIKCRRHFQASLNNDTLKVELDILGFFQRVSMVTKFVK